MDKPSACLNLREGEPLPCIGSVPYLNARPLLDGIRFPLTELAPARLGEAFQAGEFDASLLSSVDVLGMEGGAAVDGISISSRGDVYSVILAYTGELQSLEDVQLDPASHTSNALLQIILGEFYGLQPKYVRISDERSLVVPENLPALLIGDRAISFRKRRCSPEVRYLDLGGEWFRHTKLPFVFALWALRSDYTKKRFLSEALREAKIRGLIHRQEIAAKTSDPDFTLRYLTDWIRYDLGDEEKKGLKLFAELLKKYRLMNHDVSEITYW